MRTIDRFEIDAVKACNLSCAACNHVSPMYKKGFVDVGEMTEDLGIMARHVHAKLGRILGGEPLLHPGIDRVVQAVKASGIADQVYVVTNGVLLHRMSDAFWSEVDFVEVSVYPGVKIDVGVLKERKGKIFARECPTFYETFSTVKNENEELVRRIKEQCSILNWCMGLVDRRFYKCMRSAYISDKVPHPLLEKGCDGIEVKDDEGFGERLAAYLKQNEILKSCYFCTGNAGKRFPHAQVPHENWMDRQHRPVQDMI